MAKLSNEEYDKMAAVIQRHSHDQIDPYSTYAILMELKTVVGGDLDKTIAFMVGYLFQHRR